MKSMKNLFSILNPFSKSKRVKTTYKKRSKKVTKRIKRRPNMKGGWGGAVPPINSHVMKGGWGMPVNN